MGALSYPFPHLKSMQSVSSKYVLIEWQTEVGLHMHTETIKGATPLMELSGRHWMTRCFGQTWDHCKRYHLCLCSNSIIMCSMWPKTYDENKSPNNHRSKTIWTLAHTVSHLVLTPVRQLFLSFRWENRDMEMYHQLTNFIQERSRGGIWITLSLMFSL